MRRLLAVSAALVLSGFGTTALALSAPSAPPAADVCSGPGFRQIGSADAPLCVHRSFDLPPTDAVTAPLPAKPPTCYGDGESGARVQLVYGWLQGRPDRSATTVPLIRKEVAPRMDGLIRSNSPGHDLGIRFAFEAGCRQLSVLRIAFPASVAAGSAGRKPEVHLTRMSDHLASLGHSDDNRKYVVMWDEWNEAPVCGIATLRSAEDTRDPVNLHDGLYGADILGLTPKYAVTFARALSPRGPACWLAGRSGATVPVHELLHTLGAVQLSAPNSDGAGHCLDGPSTMCPNGGTVICQRAPVEQLDCRRDDYWDPDAKEGSYLAEHRNIARSRFFGPSPLDDLPSLPARS
ncbi:MAG TPA: hypothetical protein VNA30_07470 [Mycobacteriales bacterium]|nr:hypothetical protein [Mycobacteriales bacterium]